MHQHLLLLPRVREDAYETNVDTTKDYYDNTLLAKFTQRKQVIQSLLKSFKEIHEWSVKEPAHFWEKASENLNILYHTEKIVDDTTNMPNTNGLLAHLNYAETAYRIVAMIWQFMK